MHFMITSYGKSRIYTNCISLSKNSQAYTDNLLKDYKKQILNFGDGPENENYAERLSDQEKYLPVVIKTYQNPKAPNCLNKTFSVPLSLCLKDSPIGTEFTIDGPFGRGLGLKPDSKGDYVFIGIGTGN